MREDMARLKFNSIRKGMQAILGHFVPQALKRTLTTTGRAMGPTEVAVAHCYYSFPLHSGSAMVADTVRSRFMPSRVIRLSAIPSSKDTGQTYEVTV